MTYIWLAVLVVAAFQCGRFERKARRAKAEAWRELIAKMRRLADHFDADARSDADRRHASTLRGMASAWEHKGDVA